MKKQLAEIEKLYSDNKQCAESIGLIYESDDGAGYGRRRSGKGFSFTDENGKTITDTKIKQQISELVIPPAWQKVWICPKPKGHILATGIDAKGRKQYIYNHKWRVSRDLLNFYRLLTFGVQLPKLREHIETQLRRRTLDREKIMAIMLWLIDHAYIRIGNDTYFEQNNTIGLSTLQKRHIVISGSTLTLAFVGKSSQEHEISIDDERISKLLLELMQQKGKRLFTYKGRNIESKDVNELIKSIAGPNIHAKDFRTWGGTLSAFIRLREESKRDKPVRNDKAIVSAVDDAAEALGNTRSVARSHYIHPHLIETYASNSFSKIYKNNKAKPTEYINQDEAEMLAFLASLFENEYSKLIKS